MTTYFRLAGALGLTAALLLTACTKKSDEQTSSSTTSTDTTQSGSTAMPDASSGSSAMSSTTMAPAATPTTGAMTVTTTTNGSSNGSGSGRFITLPVYPGAAEHKEQAITSSSNEGSVTMTIYSTKDDAKTVSEWYKSHLPSTWKGNVLTAGDKTVGTFSDEHPDGDQSVIVGSDNDGTTRIQLTTKHGK